ncbi:cbb3-type cytochrome oxidase subunit 3 [Priestia megaterium]|nr:cbb3-type cytochrome oxidase subunit 3 [Priestia megaterium]
MFIGDYIYNFAVIILIIIVICIIALFWKKHLKNRKNS